MAEEPQASGNGWRAAAYQVRGPAARRGPAPALLAAALGAERFAARGEGGPPGPGDEGELWIGGDALFFSGRREAWSVPLNWLADPETDLAGITEIRLRTADRGQAITLALAGGVEQERALAATIRAARTAPPAERDRRALADLTALLAPALDALSRLVPEGEPGVTPLDPAYGTRALALAAQLQAAWLPYWGTPATRLRDATLGALVAVGVAARSRGDAAALDRAEQATERWHNACDDLAQWCGLPEEALPAARWPEREHLKAAAGAAPDPEPAYEPPAPAQSAPAAAPPRPAPAVAAAPPPTPAPAPRPAPAAPPEEQGTVIIPAHGMPRAPEPESEEGDTLVIATHGQRQPPPVSPLPQPQAPPVAPPPAVGDYDDRTIIATPNRMAEDATPPRPADFGAGRAAPPQTQPTPAAPPSPPPPAAVVAGPGRKGSGGMTMLYRSGPGGSVARKALQPEEGTRPDVVETFLNIGRRFQAVQHPNFVRILGTGREGPTPYIDMEFIEGESMSARFGRAAVPVPQALQIIGQLAAAVEAVHHAGLVHGDLRPQNVLIEPGGRVVLLEPSVACDFTLEHQRGTVYGDLAYLTPERARGDAQGAPADIYALATLAFTLLAGRPPFLFTSDPGQIFTAHAEEPPPPLDSVLPGAPPAAAAAIARALAKRPNDRPASAAAFAAELQRAFGIAGGPMPSAPEPTQVGGWTPGASGATPPPSPTPPAGAQRPGASPLGTRGASPLGNRGASPLGRPGTPPSPRNDEPPDDDLDKTVIVRPR